MYDNLIIAQIRAALIAGMAAFQPPITGIAVRQRNQPTTQGTPDGPFISIFKVSDKRYGYPKREDEVNADDPESVLLIHTESQCYETTFQIGALASQNPADVNALTASDIVNLAAAILQGDHAREALAAAGIGMLRVGDVRNPYFKTDRDQFQADPSFDFTVTHWQVIMNTSPAVEVIEANFARV